MKPSHNLPKEYSKADFILYNEYAVNESIKEGVCLFKTIKISDNGNGKALEEKPFIFLQIDLHLKDPHKIRSCISLNNVEHKRAWELLLAFNRSNYSNKTESGNDMINYLDNVMLLFESWFSKHGLEEEMTIKRLIHNKNFRSIRKGDLEFVLTEQQSMAIKYLYEIAIQGVPYTTSADVIRHVDEEQGIHTKGKRLVDVFKNNKEILNKLIIHDSDRIVLKID